MPRTKCMLTRRKPSSGCLRVLLAMPSRPIHLCHGVVNNVRALQERSSGPCHTGPELSRTHPPCRQTHHHEAGNFTLNRDGANLLELLSSC